MASQTPTGSRDSWLSNEAIVSYSLSARSSSYSSLLLFVVLVPLAPRPSLPKPTYSHPPSLTPTHPLDCTSTYNISTCYIAWRYNYIELPLLRAIGFYARCTAPWCCSTSDVLRQLQTWCRCSCCGRKDTRIEMTANWKWEWDTQKWGVGGGLKGGKPKTLRTRVLLPMHYSIPYEYAWCSVCRWQTTDERRREPSSDKARTRLSNLFSRPTSKDLVVLGRHR